MKDDIFPRNRVERKDGGFRDFVGPMLEVEPYRFRQSAARVNLPHMPAYLQSFVYLDAAATTTKSP